jgi:hypothetical protein
MGIPNKIGMVNVRTPFLQLLVFVCTYMLPGL